VDPVPLGWGQELPSEKSPGSISVEAAHGQKDKIRPSQNLSGRSLEKFEKFPLVNQHD